MLLAFLDTHFSNILGEKIESFFPQVFLSEIFEMFPSLSHATGSPETRSLNR